MQVCVGHLVNTAALSATERPIHSGEQTSFKIMPRGESRPCTTVSSPAVEVMDILLRVATTTMCQLPQFSLSKDFRLAVCHSCVCELSWHTPVARKDELVCLSFSFLPWTL